MTLPVMPAGYRWFRGGPGLSRAGRNALFASDDTQVWVWDEEAGDPVVDLLDENAQPITAPKVVDGWVLGAGLPTAVRVASFSIGRDGKRYPLEPANSLALTQDAAASAASSASSAQSAAASAATAAALVGAPAGAAIDAAAGNAKIVYVSPSGNDSASGKTWGSAKATIGAALTAMGTSAGVIVLDIGTIGAGAGVAWPATAKCGMVGQGPGLTIIQATGQTGPVIDLSAVGYGLNHAEFGGFSIVGDGTAGSAKKGLKLSSSTSIVGAYFHDIAVSATGGAGFDLGMAELCDFERLTVDQPVNAASSDIPYVLATGAFNGNRIPGLCLSATVTGSATVGASGAVVIKDNGSTAPHDNKIEAAQIEGLRVPTNGTIFALSGNGSVLSDLQVFDAGRVSGATGTSYVRFAPPAVLDLGGNIMRGVIPGYGGGTTDMNMGVDMRQSRNSIHGVKGYRGTNVTLASGVGNVAVELRGAVSTATNPAVVDNSGQTTNTVTDTYLGVIAGSNGGYKAGRSGGYFGPGNHVVGTYAATAGNLMVVPADLPSMTAVSIECNVTVAGAAGTTVRLGIYANTGTDGPGALVLDAGTVAADTTGIKAVTISQFLPAGRYWLGAAPQGGNPTFTAVTSTLTPITPASFTGGATCYYRASVTGALPDPFGSVSPFSPGIKVMVKSA